MALQIFSVMCYEFYLRGYYSNEDKDFDNIENKKENHDIYALREGCKILFEIYIAFFSTLLL